MPDSAPGVLVIEDDDEIRTFVANALRDEGWSVAVAGNGLEGLERLRSAPLPTAIVLDLMLPFMDGHEFIEELRKDPTRAGLPVIQISAGLNTAIPGIAARLDKPFRLECLFHLLDTYARADSVTPQGALAAGL